MMNNSTQETLTNGEIILDICKHSTMLSNIPLMLIKKENPFQKLFRSAFSLVHRKMLQLKFVI